MIAKADTLKAIDNMNNARLEQLARQRNYNTKQSNSENSKLPWIVKIAMKFIKFCMSHKIVWFLFLILFVVIDFLWNLRPR